MEIGSSCTFSYGRDKYSVDPDNGIICHQKLASTRGSSSVSLRLMQSVPALEDIQWTSRLYDLPGITFGTISMTIWLIVKLCWKRSAV